MCRRNPESVKPSPLPTPHLDSTDSIYTALLPDVLDFILTEYFETSELVTFEFTCESWSKVVSTMFDRKNLDRPKKLLCSNRQIIMWWNKYLRPPKCDELKEMILFCDWKVMTSLYGKSVSFTIYS